MRCQSLRRKCRACGNKVDGKRQEKCPTCGSDMHCTEKAVEGYSRCRWHGGPVPSRNFYGRGPVKDGRMSSFPITRLSARYLKMQEDGRILSNRATIDLIDKRVMQLLERVDVKEAPDRVMALFEKWQELKAQAIGSTEYLTARLEMDELFERVYHDYAAWNQIFTALELRGKATEREIKALKELRAIMTAEDGYELVAKLMAAVIRVIGDDPKKIKQVQYEFAKIIGERGEFSDRDGAEDDETAGGGEPEDRGETGLGILDQAELLHPGDQE